MEKPTGRKNIEHCPENPAVLYEGKRLKKRVFGQRPILLEIKGLRLLTSVLVFSHRDCQKFRSISIFCA
jgi:hypothetical protein